MRRLGQGLLRLRRLAERLRDDPAWRKANDVWLKQDLRRWVTTNLRTHGAQRRFGEVYAAAFGPMPKDATLIEGLHQVNSGPDLESMLASNGGLHQQRVQGGMAAVAEALAARLPGEHHLLYTDIDGSFPNHHPDPTVPANLEDLQRLVADKNLDFGVAFDGDGDRIGAIDGEGRIIWGDQLLMIYAEDLLRVSPGSTVIADVKASKALFDRVAELGPRHLEILELVLSGCTNLEISQSTTLSLGTVKNYVSSLLLALDVRSRSHLISLFR